MAGDKTILLDERALSVIADMRRRVQELGSYYGDTSPQYVKAATSLAHVLGSIMLAGFGPEARVSRDGDLSLYVIENGFHYGIIWFRDRAYDGVEGPQPGEWSQHS